VRASGLSKRSASRKAWFSYARAQGRTVRCASHAVQTVTAWLSYSGVSVTGAVASPIAACARLSALGHPVSCALSARAEVSQRGPVRAAKQSDTPLWKRGLHASATESPQASGVSDDQVRLAGSTALLWWQGCKHVQRFPGDGPAPPRPGHGRTAKQDLRGEGLPGCLGGWVHAVT